ncbi:MAG: hypothetical protein IPK69_01005 [Phycisphaerales bacterium]|nr:MAG: hypothetical protein IPK69_01005 [Phycisphaerales bacterium]
MKSKIVLLMFALATTGMVLVQVADGHVSGTRGRFFHRNVGNSGSSSAGSSNSGSSNSGSSSSGSSSSGSSNSGSSNSGSSSSGSSNSGSSNSGSSGGGTSNSGGASSGGSASGGGTSATSEVRIRLEARMRSGRVEGKLAFEYRVDRRKFQAEVSRALPNAQFVVRHNGVVIGTVVTNSLGTGRIEVHQGGDDPNQGVVPMMRAGDRITIGTMSGVLAAR